MRPFFSFLSGGVVVALLLGAFMLKVPLPLVATVAVGLACLAWLVVLVVLPWNLFFQARHVLFELGRSRAAGLPVNETHEANTRRVERRMLRLAVGLHVASAALLALGAWLMAEPLGHVFAGLFLLSTLFRPAVEYYRALRSHLSTVLEEVKYPREDVAKLVHDVQQAVQRSVALEHAHAALERTVQGLEATSIARTADAHRKLDAVTRRFDEALDRLTDNREVIAGLKAFLRLVREPQGT